MTVAPTPAANLVGSSLRRTALAAMVLAAALSFAEPAQANPAVPAAASGACIPAFQAVELGTTPTPVTCTFHFVDAHGQAMANDVISAAVTGAPGQVDRPTTPDDHGLARVVLSAPSCTTVGSRLSTVLATQTGTGTAIAGQAVTMVTCVRGPRLVEQAACVKTGRRAAELIHPTGTELRCEFHTQPQGDLDVSFGLAEGGTTRTAFIVDQSGQPDSDGNFQATVWNYGSSVTVIATVTCSRTRTSVTGTAVAPGQQG